MTDKQDAIDRLESLLAAAGDPNAAWSARDEIENDKPRYARYLFLRDLWPEFIDTWKTADLTVYPSLRRLVDAGADQDDLRLALRMATYEAVFGMLYRLDDDNPNAPDDAPTWSLFEVDGTTLETTGRPICALYESLLTMDPSGRAGRDLWQ